MVNHKVEELILSAEDNARLAYHYEGLRARLSESQLILEYAMSYADIDQIIDRYRADAKGGFTNG